MINRRRTGNKVVISSPNSEGQDVGVTSEGRLEVDSRDSIQGLKSGSLSVGTTLIEAKVEAEAASKRKGIIITPDKKIFWGGNDVTTNSGTPIFKNQSVFIAASSSAKVFLIASQANVDVRIVEVFDE